MESHNDEAEEPKYDWESLRAQIITNGGVRNVSMTVTLPHKSHIRENNPQMMRNTTDSIEPLRITADEYYKSVMLRSSLNDKTDKSI